MKREAKFYKTLSDKKVQCKLCNHSCKIDNDNFGICQVRKNENGMLKTMIYGSTSSIAVDPIEKKPLFHFYPGTNVLSLGTIGCNFKCDHCQNYTISTANLNFSYIREITPEQVIELAKERECQGIAWTYNEPTIWHEFAYDTSKLAKKSNLYTVYVSNGYIAEDPLREISKYLDAINIDVKAFDDDFYKKICKAQLKPVLETCELAKDLGIHLELTYLIIPNYNDSVEEITKFCKWVFEKLGNDIAVHFSRFHPDYKMANVPKTPMDTMIKAYEIAKETGILFPYIGNVPNGDYENTICPNCGNICIKRQGYLTNLDGINKNKCSKCKNSLPIN